MTEPNYKLLSDLARLAAKYRPKDWEQLAAWLDDESQRQRLQTLMTELAAVSRAPRKKPARRTKAPAPASRLRKELAKVRREDTRRADLLEDIWLKLRERELLPTTAAVRSFAQAMGSKQATSSRRDQAIIELMHLLIQLPGGALEERMRQTVVTDRKLGEEYEEWVRLILGRVSDARDG
jgi:hypothetical protein